MSIRCYRPEWFIFDVHPSTYGTLGGRASFELDCSPSQPRRRVSAVSLPGHTLARLHRKCQCLDFALSAQCGRGPSKTVINAPVTDVNVLS
ncbi:hypothetical protein EVAR_13776_1 [Eumeta japonica]|uniref:Uncharacterized protein n=1 Tax=Eumeta variegata TaxID=151549 RepID=A0A4C1U194_EUMVA|nr:hypothetical protein EVAR_13776_1 [Eumeta japonica]